MQIALAGFMGVGKSTIGRLLASELSRTFVDTDELVEQNLGRSILECFQAGEEATFREVEAAAVRQALGGEPSVIALGGGAPMRDDTRGLLLEKAVLVHLYVPWTEVRKWISEYAATRPLLQGRSTREIHDLYLARLAVYRQAHLEVAVPRTSPEEACRRVLRALQAGRGRGKPRPYSADSGVIHAMQPPETHVDLLERPLFAHLATVRADGAPQVNPMWFLWDAQRGVIKMTHTSRRHNYRNVEREPRVAMSITDPDDQYRYLQVRGVVESIEPDPTGSLHELLQERYEGTVGQVPDREHRVVLIIRPTAFKHR